MRRAATGQTRPRARSWLRVAACAAVLAPAGAAGQELADFDYENLTFRGFGLDVGYIFPDRVEEAFSYGVRFDLGYLGPGLRLVPHFGYWSSSFQSGEIQEFEDRLASLVSRETGAPPPTVDLGTIEWSDFTFGLDAHVVWEVPFDLLTFGGLGVAAHVLNGDGTAINGTFMEDLLDSVDAGFNLHVGAEYPLTDRMRLYGQGRYEVMEDLRYFQVRFGWQLMTGANAPGEGRDR